ncbi:MAG: hypothetical protein JSU82_03425 [Rhodospirillales bacterium]|nr:MAG: hypothetical protein JSU82_03425 [Rhodospirillales bacterium]
MRNSSLKSLAALALISASATPALAEPGLDLVGSWDSGVGAGTEVISVQKSSARAAVTNSETGSVTILDLSDPATPVSAGVFDLGLVSGEGVTSVAFHPKDDYFIVAIEIEGVFADGRVEIRSASTGAVLNTLTVGSEPDAVVIDREGEYAVVSNEGESFALDPETGEFFSPPGSVTVIDLDDGPEDATTMHIVLPDATGTPGMVNASDPGRTSDERLLERAVDLNGDGEIADEFEDGVGGYDWNNNGVIEDLDFVAGTIDGVDVMGNEESGELVLIPLLDNSPRFLEPELAAFTKDGEHALVVLQENNGVAVIDVEDGEFLGYYGLGTTTHDADIIEDDFVEFVEDALYALREPDGISVTPDGRYFVTADEGDTDLKASKTDMPHFPTAGGRTVSVFDAATGMLLGDTGNQIDYLANEAGVYPDGRSDSKGSEPENLVTFWYDDVQYAAVGLERADAVALVSLADPANPTVVDVAPVNGGVDLGDFAPEGIGYLKSHRSLYVYAANEGSGVVSVFEMTRSWHHHGRGWHRPKGRGHRHAFGR